MPKGKKHGVGEVIAKLREAEVLMSQRQSQELVARRAIDEGNGFAVRTWVDLTRTRRDVTPWRASVASGILFAKSQLALGRGDVVERWHVAGRRRVTGVARAVAGREVRSSVAEAAGRAAWRRRARNRKLFLGDVFVVYLLAFFNPAVRSLRTFEDLSQTRQAQKHLSMPKVCKSTRTDFNALSDPERLPPILEALGKQLARKQARQPASDSGDLHELLQKTIAVDGTFLPAAAGVAWAYKHRNNHRGVRSRARIDAQINVTNWLPEVLVVSERGHSETDSAIEHLQEDRLYLYDRGYMRLELLRAHHETPSANFIVRFKAEGPNASPMEVAFENDLSEEDLAAGVVSDWVGRFDTVMAERVGAENLVFREVVVRYESDAETKTLRLVTDLMDLPASAIATLTAGVGRSSCSFAG